jgi:hypothetical protein
MLRSYSRRESIIPCLISFCTLVGSRQGFPFDNVGTKMSPSYSGRSALFTDQVNRSLSGFRRLAIEAQF